MSRNWLRMMFGPRDDRDTHPSEAESLWQLSDRDLRELGVTAPAVERFSHAPVEVGNDRV